MDRMTSYCVKKSDCAGKLACVEGVCKIPGRGDRCKPAENSCLSPLVCDQHSERCVERQVEQTPPENRTGNMKRYSCAHDQYFQESSGRCLRRRIINEACDDVRGCVDGLGCIEGECRPLCLIGVGGFSCPAGQMCSKLEPDNVARTTSPLGACVPARTGTRISITHTSTSNGGGSTTEFRKSHEQNKNTTVNHNGRTNVVGSLVLFALVLMIAGAFFLAKKRRNTTVVYSNSTPTRTFIPGTPSPVATTTYVYTPQQTPPPYHQ